MPFGAEVNPIAALAEGMSPFTSILNQLLVEGFKLYISFKDLLVQVPSMPPNKYIVPSRAEVNPILLRAPGGDKKSSLIQVTVSNWSW